MDDNMVAVYVRHLYMCINEKLFFIKNDNDANKKYYQSKNILVSLVAITVSAQVG